MADSGGYILPGDEGSIGGAERGKGEAAGRKRKVAQRPEANQTSRMADSGPNKPPEHEVRKGGAEEDKSAINQTNKHNPEYVTTYPPTVTKGDDRSTSVPDNDSKNKNATGKPTNASSVKKGEFVHEKMQNYLKSSTDEHPKKEVSLKNLKKESDAEKRKMPDQCKDHPEPEPAADMNKNVNIKQENDNQTNKTRQLTSEEVLVTQDEEQPAKADSQQAHATNADRDLVNMGNSQQDVLSNIQHKRKDESFVIVDKKDCNQEGDVAKDNVLGATNNSESISHTEQSSDDGKEKFRKEKEKEVPEGHLHYLDSKSPTAANDQSGQTGVNANNQGGETDENNAANSQSGETGKTNADINQDGEIDQIAAAKHKSGEPDEDYGKVFQNDQVFQNDLSGTEEQTEEQTGVHEMDNDTQPEFDAEISRSSSVSSVETIEGAPEEENFDVTQYSLDVLKSMTHIPDDNRKTLDNDKGNISSVQGIDEPKKGQIEMEKENPVPHDLEDKNIEQDLEYSNDNKSTKDKPCADTTQYTLMPVENKKYLLLVNGSQPLEVSQLDGKSNVSLSDRCISINSELVYFIHNENGTIIIKEIGKVQSEGPSNESLKGSSTNKSENVGVGHSKKVRSVYPRPEEMLNTEDVEISKADNSNSQVSLKGGAIDSGISNITELFEGLDIKGQQQTETMQNTETKQLQTSAEQTPSDSRAAGTDTFTNSRDLSPTVPPRNTKKNKGQDKSESTRKPKVLQRQLPETPEQAPGIAIAAVTSTSTNPTGTSPKAKPRKSKNKEEVKFIRELVDSKNIKEGSDHKFECCVSHSNLTVRWLKDGEPIECSERIRVVSSEKTHSLEIQKVVPTDSGKYTVEVENKQSNSTVTVEEKVVEFTRELVPSERREEGLDLKLKCSVSHPGLTASWLKDGKPLDGSGRCKPVSSGKTHSLEIKNVILSDSGKYTVEVDNIQSTSTVTIEEKPVTFTLPLRESIETQAGKNMTLTCQVSKPDVEAKWTACGRPVNNSDKFQLESTGMVHKLLIKNVQPTDGGVYSVSVGGIQATCNLIVHAMEKTDKRPTTPPSGSGARKVDASVNKMQALEPPRKDLCREITFELKLDSPNHVQEETYEIKAKMTQQNYMKWKFVTRDQRMLKKMIGNVKTNHGYDINVDGEVTKVELGHFVTCPQLELITDDLIHIMLQNTNNLTEKAIHFSPGIGGKEVLNALNELDVVKEKVLYAEVDENASVINMICNVAVEEKMARKINGILQTLEAQLETTSDSIEKPLVFGKKIESEFFKNNWKTKFEDVEIKPKYITDTNMVIVTLRGPKKDLVKAKQWIHEYPCNEISFKTVTNSCMFTNIDQVLKEHFTSTVQNQEDVWHVNDKAKKIGVCATTPDATGQITQRVMKCIKKRTIKREDIHPNTNLELVELLREEIGEEHKPYIQIALKDDDSIDVYGLKKHIDICLDDLKVKLRKQFQQQKTDVEKTVHRPKETKPQLEKVGCFEKTLIIESQVVFEVICKSDSISPLKTNVQITPINDRWKKGFHLQGTEGDVNCIHDELKTMERNVVAWTVCSEIKQNQKTQFDEVTHELERSSPVVVIKEEAVDIDGVTSDAKKKVEWFFPYGHTVKIVQTCTSSDTKSCVKFLEDTKGCFKDPIIDNPDGSLLMLVPVWKDGTLKEKDTIHERFLACLSRLLSKPVSHVDICIDNIILSWKVPMFVKQLLVPLMSRLKKKEEPLTICFCCKNESITKEVYNSCKGAFAVSKSYQGEHKDQNRCYDGVTVNIKSGNIAETKADIIVNTINPEGQLVKGAISNSILKEAGSRIQEELRNNISKQKLKIYLTEAYNMKNCKYVFHVCLEKNADTDMCMEGLEECVYNCLIKAEALKCCSIAFPALGAGGLGYDLAKVICAMFNAVERFNKSARKAPLLKEVNFVLYEVETAKMYRQEKKRRGMNHLEETDSHSFRNITLNAVNVPIKDVDTDCILYVWDKQVIHTAAGKPGENSLLRELDFSSRSRWTDYFRRQTVPVFQAFFTSGDKKLKFKEVIHVPYEDNKENKIKALVEGLKAAISKKKQSVAIYFDNAHPFLRDKDFMTKVSAAVSDTSPLAKQVLDVKVVIGNPFFEKVEMFFRENSQTAFTEQAEGVENVVMTVVGMETDLSATVEKLRNQKGVCLMEVHRPYPELNKKRKAPLPPKDMTIDRDATNDKPSPDDHTPKSDLTWKPEYLQRVPELELYVEMQNIPKTETTVSLKLKLFDLRLPIAIPELVYCDNSDVAIIICQTMEDAKKLSDHKSSFKFVRLVNKKTLHCFSSTLDARVWNMAKANGLLAEIMKKLKEMHVVIINEETPEIKTSTLYQIKCARGLLAKYDTQQNGKFQMRRKDEKRESFTIITPKEVIENVDESVWDIVSEKCQKDISLFENDFGEIKYEKNTLCIPSYTEDKHEAIVKKITSKLDETKKKEIVEIASTEIEKVTDMTKIPNCCKEIEIAFNSAWCVWNDKKKKIYVCDERYETAFQVKHQLSTKLGITKVTGRGRGKRTGAISKEDEKSTSDSLSDKLNERQHPLAEDYNLDHIAKHLEKFTVGNILVYVYQGDILKLPVDCIVNAANESLSHGGGVAAVIERAAGDDLTREGNTFIREKGKLAVGEACVTTAGKLHYKYVIHTVGPAWRDYTTRYRSEVRKCETDLYSAIYRCFEIAQERKMKTIAIPAVSSAIFGVPADICVEQYAKATIDYCNRAQNAPDALSEIHFIDIKLDIVKKIQDSFRNKLREGRVSKGNGDDFASQTTERKDGYENQKLDAHLEAGQLPDPLMYEDGWKKNKLIFAPNDTLTVCMSDIFSLKASAIVVSVNKQGQGGKIKGSLLNKIPSGYMEAFNKELRGKIGNSSKIGDVAVIDGYSCGYASILFVVYPFEAQRGTNRHDFLRKAFSNVLDAAHRKKRITSVVTTLFGIDSTKDDELILAAEAFLESYLSFCKQTIQYEPWGLDVTIACHTEHSHDVVLKVFNDYVKSKRESNESSGKEGESDLQAASNTRAEAGEEEKCVICMDSIKEPKTLKCGHAFCTECIEQYFTFKQQCPTCGTVCGQLTGDQPFGHFRRERNPYQHLAGYDRYDTIVITYTFPNGTQEKEHPNPGTQYRGIVRKAYLPDNEEGNKIADMLKVAFDRKLIFTIGSSRTTGQEGVITWNDIHHKTDHRTGTQFGYPDPTYLERVKDELAAKGVTEADIASQ